MRVARASRRAWAAAAACAALAGCRAALPAVPQDDGARAVPAGLRRDGAATTVPVRLSALERVERVRVGGTIAGTLEFVRAGDGVARSDGRSAGSFTVEPQPAGPGLSIGERTYGGTLSVEPHGAGGLRVTERVALEDYVAGVVAGELVLWSALPAEIEAQAVAARTYALGALAARGPGGFLWDDARDQAYRGRFGPAGGAGAREVQARLERALGESAGLVLERGGEPLDARYHAACGGRTADFADAFPEQGRRGSGAVDCEPCARLAADPAGGLRWSWTASARQLGELARALGLGRHLVSLAPARTDDSGRWRAVDLIGDARSRRVHFAELRRRLGPADLQSGRIVSTWPHPGRPITGGLRFEGLGRGHGAGLCQTGAREYARRGWSARQILSHYYPGSELVLLDVPLLAGTSR